MTSTTIRFLSSHLVRSRNSNAFEPSTRHVNVSSNELAQIRFTTATDYHSPLGEQTLRAMNGSILSSPTTDTVQLTEMRLSPETLQSITPKMKLNIPRSLSEPRQHRRLHHWFSANGASTRSFFTRLTLRHTTAKI